MVRPERSGRQVPVDKLIERLWLADYDRPAPLSDMAINPATVRIKLKQHVGPASRPKVSVGHRVAQGDLVAEAASPTSGARLHASISGLVAAVTAAELIITR